jgi:hypothetical protein
MTMASAEQTVPRPRVRRRSGAVALYVASIALAVEMIGVFGLRGMTRDGVTVADTVMFYALVGGVAAGAVALVLGMVGWRERRGKLAVLLGFVAFLVMPGVLFVNAAAKVVL